MTTPVAGSTHHLTLSNGVQTYGFMLENGPGRYVGPERLSDFAPRIAIGNEPKLREGLWDVVAQTGAVEGIDQYVFTNANRIYRSDGNVFFGRDEAVGLQSAATSSDASQSATAPQFSESGTTHILAAVGTKIRRYNISGNSWSDSTTTLGANAVWLHRHDGRDFACLGSGSDFVTSTNNGDTWSAAAAGVKADGLVTHKNQLYLWLGRNLRASANKNGGSWSSTNIEVGDPGSNITNAVSAFGVLLVRKEDGLYYYADGKVEELIKNKNTLYSGNRCLCFHSDGFVYFNELGRIKKFSMTSGAIANLTDVTPEMKGSEARELYGHGVPIWIWSGPSDNLFVAFDDGESVYPEILYHNGLGWHQFYRGASGDTMRAGGYSRLTAKTWFNDGASRYRAHTTLRDFPAASYHASGVWETSDIDGGLPFMYKAFRDISLEGRNLGSDRTIAVAYSTDKGANWTTCGTANTDGKALFSVDPASIAVGAQHLRFRFTLTRGATTTESPILERWSCRFLTRPDPVYGYRLTLKIGAGQEILSGVETQTVQSRLDFLRQCDASKTPLTFTDMFGVAQKVYLSQLSVVQPSLALQLIQDERLVDVTLVEATPMARWDAFNWNAAAWV